MATATHQGSPTWRANNVNRPAGSGRKWDDPMRRKLVEAVKEADRAGLPRRTVFTRFAKTWTARETGVCAGESYSEHQVASQFHLSKERLGYEVPAQIQRLPATTPRKLSKNRQLLAPPTKSGTNSLVQANKTIDDLRQKLVAKEARIRVLRAQRNDAQAEAKEARRELGRTTA